MKVLFRADSSSKIGHEYIRRDLLLALRQYYEDEVSFACLELEGNIIENIPYEVFLLDSSAISELIDLILDEGFELLIIDHYQINAKDEKLIKEATGVEILSFDDELKPHYCDILLNVNPYAKAELYKNLVPSFCELRCGFAYALIRDEFYEEAKITRKKIHDIFICLDSTDSANLSAKIALDLPSSLSIIIATSSKNKNLKALTQICKNHKNITLAVDLKDFAKTMNESKKLIIQASSLVNEALILKAKFKAICTHKNQEKIAFWLKDNGKEVEFYDKAGERYA
ncbi:UDP-2,4-diacetamido-2,4,6-trideoxy-beta-L-altropyranose hydrolase [Campylobacter sp. MIT 97-5078]|uniref:UDP-2,4-diacetamido-2,4, 6-trideoxy-beta-L-altropyranose hydrolase n=1 Tax=Campylobacter sp. MIT 97-5078 TaxID=1548153 RepID=UPI0005142D53|nr:UDP-2,4-diacetamido-2,4,6-trideoxy-beta-L-altropyranose hydrolase [Campylobacter sp. MIT 97-5078]KGI56531.1 nucleotidase [Campylobacter sp. MIT 97-5078]TQR27019.1 UDP-2,4-diacetamido-2,4,6-trideoxy-beta-L-altropyranose hydrolase [Campylobacter sp. MIT 97-5078]